MAESRFDFLRELVKNIPDISVNEELECGSPGAAGDSSTSAPSSPQPQAGSSWHIQVPPSTPSASSTSTYLGNGLWASQVVPTTSSAASQPHVPPLPHQQSVIQHTSTHRNNFTNHKTVSNNATNPPTSQKQHYGPGPGRPPKLARYDSAPPNLNIDSNYKIEIMPPKINTPNISTGPSPIFNIDLSKGFFNATSTSGSANPNPASPLALTKPNSEQPVVKIELANPINYSANSTLSSPINEQQPVPPIIRSDVCNTPVIKIDYSKIATFTPLSSPEINTTPPPPIPTPSTSSSVHKNTDAIASTSSSATAVAAFANSAANPPTQTQQKPQTPSTSVNIDFSTFNSSLMKTAKRIYPPLQPPTQNSSCLDMDEDYDNI